jgi:hypothetical protein
MAADKPKPNFWSSTPNRVPGVVKQVRGAKYPPLYAPHDSRFASHRCQSQSFLCKLNFPTGSFPD